MSPLRAVAQAPMVLHTMTVHPRGILPAHAAKAWYLRVKAKKKWREIQEEMVNAAGGTPSRHALQNAVARMKSMVQQKEDASPRRRETRPHEGKETVDNAGRKGRGRRPATTPEHRRGGCIRGRGAVDAEIESRRLATCPCGWHQEEPGGTRGHGPHPPLAMGHGVLLLGHGLLGHVEPFPRQMSSGWGSLGRALADVPGRGSLGGDPEGGVPRVRRQKC